MKALRFVAANQRCQAARLLSHKPVRLYNHLSCCQIHWSRHGSCLSGPRPTITTNKLHYENKFNACRSFTMSNDEIKVVEFSDVEEASQSGSPLIVDVRNIDEFAEGRIPRAVNLPLGELKEAITLDSSHFKEKYKFDKPQVEDTLICLCKAGIRAVNAEAVLKESGYNKVLVYKGSFLDWKANDGEVVVDN